MPSQCDFLQTAVMGAAALPLASLIAVRSSKRTCS